MPKRKAPQPNQTPPPNNPPNPPPSESPTPLTLQAALRRVTNEPGYLYIKRLGERMADLYEGGLPRTEEDNLRYANAGVMRKGFQLLFAEIEKQAATEAYTGPFDEVLNQPITAREREEG